MGGHARSDYVVCGHDKKLRRIFRDGKGELVGDFDSEPETFAYTYIFGKQEEQRYSSDEPFIELGKAMMADARVSPDSIIPAGYTYLGQFIFHDITYMKINPVKNHRSPALDLDSVLEKDPAADTETPFKLRPIGCTTMFGASLPEDLPRRKSKPNPGKPLIVDERNDDFLPLAQCHLLLLKFYNAIARSLGHGCWPDSGEAGDFRSAVRKLYVQHFQSVVLHDYLPRIVSREIYDDVMNRGRQIVRTDRDDPAWLPI
jgi:hypothetical protein